MMNLRRGVLSAILQSTVVSTVGRICGYYGCKVQGFPIEVNSLNQQTMTLPRKEILIASSLGSSPSPKHPIHDSPGVFQH